MSAADQTAAERIEARHGLHVTDRPSVTVLFPKTIPYCALQTIYSSKLGHDVLPAGEPQVTLTIGGIKIVGFIDDIRDQLLAALDAVEHSAIYAAELTAEQVDQ